MVPHIAKAAENGVERVVVLSNDTDVVVLMLHYMNKFFSSWFERIVAQVWYWFIPIHTLCIKIGNIQYSVLKAHILTGCDVMSKVNKTSSSQFN